MTSEERFVRLFGAAPEVVAGTCLILPHAERALFDTLDLRKTHKGLFFDLLESPHATVILLKKGILGGDCVLSLKETTCRRIVLFGSCGGIEPREIGDGILAKAASDYESFARMSEGATKTKTYAASTKMIEKFLEKSPPNIYTQTICASVGSLILEDGYLPFFKKQGIGCIDMQAASVLCAAKEINREALAVFYVSDIIGRVPFYEPLKRDTRQRIHDKKQRIIQPLIEFIKNDN